LIESCEFWSLQSRGQVEAVLRYVFGVGWFQMLQWSNTGILGVWTVRFGNVFVVLLIIFIND